MKKTTLLTLFLVFLLILKAQNKPVALGEWRVHLPYQNVHCIVETKNKLFAAAQYGGFYLDKNEETLTRMSPSNGFSEYEIETMKYDWLNDALIIAYKNTKIEVIYKNKTVKNDDIFNKSIVGTKKIQHINIVGNLAYISTSFGLLEYDFIKNEFKNSYQNIGSGGSTIGVYASSILNDSIYISTDKAILKAKVSNVVNLADYNNWYVALSAQFASRHIAAFNQKLYAERDSQLFVYSNKKWELLEPDSKLKVTNIEVNHNQLIIGVFGKHIININSSDVKTYQGINVLSQAIIDINNTYWYASSTNGLVVQRPAGEINIFPNGPRNVNSYQMLNAFNDFYVMGGSFRETNYAPIFSNTGFYKFNNFNWENSDQSNPLISSMYDFTLASYQKNTNRMYLGTHGRGILQLNNGVPTKIFDETNSPLRKRGNLFNIISGLTSDKNNNLWVSNYDVDSTLHQYTNKGEWISYKLPVNTNSKIIIDSRNNKWMVVLGAGILVLNDKNTNNPTDDVILRLNNNKGQGNLPTNNVNDIAFTKNGELLIGTDLGYVRVRNPNNIFTGGNFEAERTVVSVEEGTNLGGNILEFERVICIVVDGGDRRWFGTDKGAWLYDKDGTTLLHHFTKENSPLPSNNILSIGINENTGEVFFGTDKGLVSFRADALPASKTIENLVIYPNPVKPDFDGDVAITGLIDNTLVKITDINGNLIYQTFSNGGMATWNCKTFSGDRPSTGVYLVFCITADGAETNVGKILFIK